MPNSSKLNEMLCALSDTKGETRKSTEQKQHLGSVHISNWYASQCMLQAHFTAVGILTSCLW